DELAEIADSDQPSAVSFSWGQVTTQMRGKRGYFGGGTPAPLLSRDRTRERFSAVTIKVLIADSCRLKGGTMDRVRIFDTTLRDGEQSPGATLNADEKLEIARQLARLGVDVVEAGFPVASPDDFAAVRRIAELVDGPVICGLARAVEADVDRCWEAVKVAQRPCIHVFMSTSDIHLEHQFRKSRLEALEATRAMVARARGYCEDIEFSPMDA